MTFTVSGTFEGRPAIVVWADGELSGTASAVARVQELVGLDVEVWATPTGPHYTAALEPAEVALLAIRSIFEDDLLVGGDVPKLELEEIPNGATP